MTFDEFITKYNGKGIDFDGWFGDQCVDLMNQYVLEVLGVANPSSVLPGDTAYHIYQNAKDPRFTKVPNTPTGVPQKGDIVFWDTTLGPAGHVAVFITGDTTNFTSFDQNFPTGSLCHSQNHSYNSVAGWLHFQGGVTVNDNITRKSSFFDQIWQHRFGNQTNTDQATQQQVNEFNAWLDSNVHRAGAFDQVCLGVGLTGDSNQITAQQVLGKITDPTASKKLAQIKTIVNE